MPFWYLCISLLQVRAKIFYFKQELSNHYCRLLLDAILRYMFHLGHNVRWNQSRMRSHNMFSREAHCMKTSVLLTRPSGFPGSLPATLSPCYTAFSMIQAPSIITAKVLIMTSNSVGTLANGNTAGCWRKCYHYLYFRLGDKLMRINTIDIKIISYCCYYVEKLLHCRFHSIIRKKQFSLNNTTFVFKIYSKMPFKIAKLIILTA